MAEKPPQKKRGGKLGIWFFKISLKLFGLSGAYGLLYFVCLYYLIFDRTASSAGMAYISRRYRGHNIFRKFYYVYKLLINQGKSLIDRYYITSGLGIFDMEIKGYEKIENLLKDSKKGLVLLTAHVGNWQVTMTALEKLEKTIYLLMRPEDNIAVKDALNIDHEQERIKVISPEGFLGGVVELMKAVDEGNIVSIMGDRTYGFDSVEADFLGEKAHFPYGAFSIAAATGCPVVALLSAKVSTRQYDVNVSNIITPRHESRGKKRKEIERWVQWFAGILEDYVARYPLQWFVFHDIWTSQASLD
jgi:predicted LPLAT superfamily acyltransferase